MFKEILNGKIFLQNKYLKWYLNIIENAISLNRKKNKDIYFERHHILPKSCFKQYSKENWNIVYLTAKEHFICHLLLVKFSTGQIKHKLEKGIVPFIMLKNKRKLSSHQFEKARKANSSFNCGYKNGMYGKIHTNESKEKVSKKLKGTIKSEETKIKMSIAQRGLKRSQEAIENNRKARLGYKFSPRHIENLSRSTSGKNNPRFLGYYSTPFGMKDSPEGFLDIGLHQSNVKKWCKYENNRIISSKSYNKSIFLKENFPINIIGKTFNQIGFSFIEKGKQNG